MKKMFCSMFVALLIVCTTVSPAFAQGMHKISTTYIRDHYQLLSSDDLQSFETQAAQLSNTYQCNVYLTIVDTLDGYTGSSAARKYAEDYWNTYDLGRGSEKDGIMLLIAVDSRDYVTITHGQGETGGTTLFTDYRIEQIEDAVVDELKDDNWTDACAVYLDKVSETMSFDRENGESWDSDNDPESAQSAFIFKLIATIVIPLLIAGGACAMWASQMKTARLKKEARDYLDESSFALTHKEDRYLTTTRTAVKIEEDRDSGGGGSTISSSGFGGSDGGKF